MVQLENAVTWRCACFRVVVVYRGGERGREGLRQAPRPTWREYMSHDVSACHMTWVHVTWREYMSHDVSTCHMTWEHVTWRESMSHGVSTCHMAWVHVTWRECMSHGMSTCHVTWVHVTWREYMSRDVSTCHMKTKHNMCKDIFIPNCLGICGWFTMKAYYCKQ